MDLGDLEGLAESLRREAGLEDVEPGGVAKIARALWRDPDAVQLVPKHALRWTPAMLANVEGKWRVFVRRDVTPTLAGFLIGHEIGHWALRREGARFESDMEEERACDQIGAALVAPRRWYHRAIAELGRDVSALAERFGTTQSLALLRLGELTRTNLALVRPGLVRVRGQLEFVWPDENTIRGWATGRAPCGIVKTKGLDGDRRRVALVVDDVA